MDEEEKVDDQSTLSFCLLESSSPFQKWFSFGDDTRPHIEVEPLRSLLMQGIACVGRIVSSST